MFKYLLKVRIDQIVEIILMNKITINIKMN
jgi:hypothetical protein